VEASPAPRSKDDVRTPRGKKKKVKKKNRKTVRIRRTSNDCFVSSLLALLGFAFACAESATQLPDEVEPLEANS